MNFGQYINPLDSMSQRKDFYGKGTDYKRFSKTEKRYAFPSQITDLIEKLVNIIEEAERSSPVRAFDMQNSISTALKDMQKQLNHISKYDWDFDNYLEEDVPAAIEYIKDKNETNNGKLLAIGHSMGGILLYAMLSRCGKDSGLAAVTTLASSLDYTSSRSSLKLLLPLADPAQVLNVPVIPIGTLLAAAHPFAANPPYLLSWLSPQISAPDMLQPKLFEKLDNAQMLNVDFGIDAFNCHIAHYDIVGAQWAVDLVYPCIIEFLNHHDAA
ncbi:hypothetical protein ES319_D07G120100v1 [Gossypium barbadense]|uniref:Serine aminopeptidase S33 domain-containing protein n=1 Tax=Gossypium barbadense TaxID=3634 RepID=A0A5J5QPW6_GOSBA|nr:hypothetical protein ES319_D07G120100v1 [Gossypium barbadense]